jgi:two-component sensor histidine kinase
VDTCACILTLTQAVPFALIIHELATCAFRVGEPGGKGLRVIFDSLDAELRLRFVFREGSLREAPHSEWLDLATMLAEQLKGSFSTGPRGNGTWTLRFPA